MWKSNPDGSPERLIALADGVFAIAITLLVLDLTVPRDLNPEQYREALRELLPDLGAYALSVLVLGGFSARPPDDLPLGAPGGRTGRRAVRARAGRRRWCPFPPG
ncbi:hypothetical protein SGLAM104S_03071 [Streptomyces glaucescens]